MHVLAFGGIAGSGKTTAADFCEVECIDHDCQPIRLSFADPVRAEAAKQAGYSNWRLLKKNDPNLYRTLCQQIGDQGRPSKWVNYVNERLKEIAQEELQDQRYTERLVIIDDVRFQNEIDMLQAWESTLVFIFCGPDGRKRLQDPNGSWRVHPSEWLAQRIEAGAEDTEGLFQWAIFNNKDNLTLEAKLMERMPYLVGSAANRFGTQCECPACRGFKCDIQVDELIDGFTEGINELRVQNDIPEDMANELINIYKTYIEKLRTGELTPFDIIQFEQHDDDDDESEEDDDAVL